MTDIKSTQVLDQSQGPGPIEIPDYTLESRIGIGGYGEVWRAIGPGGLPKAIKILFGQMDGPQADAELRSLDLMRNLRHPFLLNIERIEVIAGRLVVVTELADGSLENRFQALRDQDQKGIPREELLGYLRDTADALDFMFEEHGLQHLDIKPDNLMLQGKHVKVGDFGLAKDVSATNMSLVGGFTPLYAAPEIYEGRPSRSSDQYSLAIVYQQMLTGQPPFAGRTAAQLTAQHLNSAPDLSPLQPVDRPVIARALSKNPTARFPGCRQFVDELTKRRNSRTRTRTPASKSSGHPTTTERVDACSLAAASNPNLLETLPLPPTDCSDPARFRPTVFVGVGGLGGDVLSCLRSRFCTAFKDQPTDALRLLYVDSDRAAINAARTWDEEQRLTEAEVLATPLRSAIEYRTDTDLDLQWLSRRWLFNVPRSGEVEGIRPLGRLALIDHRDSVIARLEEAITAATSDEARLSTGEVLGSELAGGVDIVLVGSTAGGTSSGAILDMAALARTALANLEIEDNSLVGMLLHATSSQREVGDIQQANTISCLTELKHYRTPGLECSNPFDHTYIVQLGDSLTSPEFAERADTIVDYLLTTTTTGARASVDHWREQEQRKSGGLAGVRTFGLASVNETVFELVNREARSLCYALAQRWSAPGAHDGDLSETTQLLTRLGLTELSLSESIMNILRGEAGRAIEHWSQQRWSDISSRPEAHACSELFDELDAAIACRTDATVARIMDQVRSVFPGTAGDAAQQLGDHLVGLLDQPGRINKAAAAATEVVEEVRKSLEASRKLLAEVEHSLAELKDASSCDPSGSSESGCHQYCVIRFYQKIYCWFVEHVGEVLAGLQDVTERISSLRADTRSFAAAFVESGTVPTSQPDALIDAFDNQMLTESTFHLADLCMNATAPADAHAAMLTEANAFMLANLGTDGGGNSASSFPDSAAPEMQNVGGGRRVLAVLPTQASLDRWQPKLTAAFGDCICHRIDETTRQVAVICEVEGIDIETLLANFKHKNARLAEVACRIHTRVDIQW